MFLKVNTRAFWARKNRNFRGTCLYTRDVHWAGFNIAPSLYSLHLSIWASIYISVKFLMCERNRIRSALTIRVQTVASSILNSCISNRTLTIHFSHSVYIVSPCQWFYNPRVVRYCLRGRRKKVRGRGGGEQGKREGSACYVKNRCFCIPN